MKIKENIIKFISTLGKFFRRNTITKNVGNSNKIATKTRTSGMDEIVKKNKRKNQSNSAFAMEHPIYIPNTHQISTYRDQQRAALKRRRAKQ